MSLARAERLDLLRRKQRTQVLVVGGGINGISTFRELAMNGVDVVLVDKGDFMSGASSAPSRMIHGGLRYMENGEFALVRESLRERNLLLRNAPHLVSPLPTVIPLTDRFSGVAAAARRFLGGNVAPGGRGALIVKLGLMMYDLFAGKAAGMPRHRFLGRAETRRRWPGFPPGLVASAIYYDARISHPERLGIELILDTEHVGGLALNHVGVEAVTESGAALRDALTGERFRLDADIVVNASGAWIDLVNGSIAPNANRLIGGTKGSHIVIANDRLHDALGDAMVYFANDEGRVCILFAHLGNVLAGSTDISIDDPDSVRCEPDEVAYILASIRQVFADIEVGEDAILFRFAGVRPLPFSDGKVNANISRDHSCDWLESKAGAPRPVLNLVGGKWTTFRAFGAEAADLVMQRLGVARMTSTEHTRIGGGSDYPSEASRSDWIADFARDAGEGQNRATVLLERYGTRARELASAAARRLQNLPGYTREEIAWILANEHVATLSDLVLRRLTIAFTRSLDLAAIEELAVIAANHLGWDDSRRQREVVDLLAELEHKHGLPADRLASRKSDWKDDDVRREESPHEPAVRKRQMS